MLLLFSNPKSMLDQLSKDLKDELMNRQHRNNICILGMPELTGGKKNTAELVQELYAFCIPGAPGLVRLEVHRGVGSQSRGHARLRPIVACFCFFEDKMTLLCSLKGQHMSFP